MSILGDWDSGMMQAKITKTEFTMSMEGQIVMQAAYKVRDNALVLATDGETQEMGFRLEGGNLLLDMSGEVMTFYPLGKAPSAEAMADAAFQQGEIGQAWNAAELVAADAKGGDAGLGAGSFAAGADVAAASFNGLGVTYPSAAEPINLGDTAMITNGIELSLEKGAGYLGEARFTFAAAAGPFESFLDDHKLEREFWSVYSPDDSGFGIYRTTWQGHPAFVASSDTKESYGNFAKVLLVADTEDGNVLKVQLLGRGPKAQEVLADKTMLAIFNSLKLEGK
ncbi:hypothetical protein TREAZ_3305 [Leadbettera azotonutricia ZAS-9]|uniref:Uncharacterized protein n=2 Tax=Leadbettera azotonutricia TaxID=150829 RepID=F5Y8L1_LEAAZ|nr:hypothetical protein TREAZ_3305 [Leadbettera azotonutricia ZAS-9]